MGNCLVTKLKGVVNNDNLEKLGSISLYPKGITGAPIQAFNIMSSTPYTAEIIGGDYNFVGTNGESLGELKKVTVPAGQTLYMAGYCLPANANNGRLEISNKYNFTNISPSNVDGYTFEVDLNSIKYMPELRTLYIPSNATLVHLDFENIPATLTSLSVNIPGDISKLVYNPNLTNLVLNYAVNEGEFNVGEVFPNLTYFTSRYGQTQISILSIPSSVIEIMCASNSGIYGNINLFNNTNITKLWIDGTRCTGTIEEFVAAQVAAGRTSGTVAVDIHNTEITYQGRHSKSYTQDLVWENGVITSFPIEFID